MFNFYLILPHKANSICVCVEYNIMVSCIIIQLEFKHFLSVASVKFNLGNLDNTNLSQHDFDYWNKDLDCY